MLKGSRDDVIANLKGKRVGVLGLGLRSGVPLVRFLHGLGCQVVVCDRKDKEQLGPELARLEGVPAELRLGSGYLANISDCQVLFRTPFMRPDVPQLEAAVAAGSQLSSEIELVFALARAPISGITGSDGKTTTTTLISEMLKADGRKVFLGGNIGNSLIEEVLDIPADAEIVLELSSFQLMTLAAGPAAALVTNLSPNHLDYHTSYEEYVAAKTNLLRRQNKGDFAVLNFDDQGTRELAALTSGQVHYFSRRQELPAGAFLRRGQLILRDGEDVSVCHQSELQLLGDHNVENMLAAALLAHKRGARPDAIRQVALTFMGVEHRLEPVRDLDGVRYYNDSIASSPSRTAAGLAALPYPVVLIAGGYDKKISFIPLAQAIVKGQVQALALIGETAALIRAAVEAELKRDQAQLNMQDFAGLAEALAWAKEQAQPGSAVVLSPACASFDMFRDFEERGRAFKDLVMALQ